MPRTTIATLTIDDVNLDALEAGVLKQQPLPTDGLTEEPLITMAQHYQAVAEAYFQRMYEKSTIQITAQGAVVKENIFE